MGLLERADRVAERTAPSARSSIEREQLGPARRPRPAVVVGDGGERRRAARAGASGARRQQRRDRTRPRPGERLPQASRKRSERLRKLRGICHQSRRARSRPTCAAAWLRRGSRKSSAESTCFQAAGSSSPGGRLQPRPQRVAVVAGHHRVAHPALERVALALDARRVGVRQQRARVELRRLLDGAAQQQRADAPEVGLHMAAEAVRVGLDREPEQLAQPRDLAADGAVARVVAVDLGAQLLGGQAVRAQAQEREDLGLPAAERRPSGRRRSRAGARRRAGAAARRRRSWPAGACSSRRTRNAPVAVERLGERGDARRQRELAAVRRAARARSAGIQPAGSVAITRPLEVDERAVVAAAQHPVAVARAQPRVVLVHAGSAGGPRPRRRWRRRPRRSAGARCSSGS